MPLENDILKSEESQSESIEIKFKYTFKRKLNEEEQNDFWNKFIQEIEKNRISYGGGHDSIYLEGYIDFGDSPLITKEVVLLLEQFAAQNMDLVELIEIENIN